MTFDARPVGEAEPAVPPTGAAAFFDVDNTMVNGTSMIQLGKGLYRRGYFDAKVIARAVWLETSFRFSGEKHTHIDEVRNSLLQVISGRTVAEVQEDIKQIYEAAIAPRIVPRTKALALAHQTAGTPVWLVTAAPADLAEVIAADLGMSGALGTRGESRDGVFTGRIEGDFLHGPAKATAVRALADREGFDLANCHAYSDSYNDLPLLQLVGHAHVVNPDHRLKLHAKAHGWPIHEFRGRGKRRTMIASAATAAVVGTIAWRRRSR